MPRGREDSKNNLIKTLALCLFGPSGWLSLSYWFCPQVDGYQRVTQCLLQTQFPEKIPCVQTNFCTQYRGSKTCKSIRWSQIEQL